MNPEKAWYLIYTKPRQEEVAKTNLERQGYTIYLPLAYQYRRRHDKRARTIAPLFPRYLFIQLTQYLDNWGPIRSTLGVTLKDAAKAFRSLMFGGPVCAI